MKVYKISPWAFYGICLLIILLPVSLQWRLLINGTVTEGTVGEYIRIVREIGQGNGVIEYVSEVHFTANGQEHTVYGPGNLEYKKGRTIKVVFDPEDPTDFCIVTFSGFYLKNYTTLPIILLVVWYAFYLSFNRYSRKMKIPGQKNSRGKSGSDHRQIPGKV